ncbi:hypothetical protein, partial [Nostoc punctiforme]|uniref:hypothetical protein n=1 Tax=Nostoc punctiforme TaxID=272131 RepID=UPI001F54E96F
METTPYVHPIVYLDSNHFQTIHVDESHKQYYWHHAVTYTVTGSITFPSRKAYASNTLGEKLCFQAEMNKNIG